MVQDKRNN
jgi:hypothetical protein